MAAYLTDTLGELRELLHDMREVAESTGYGFFPGGDPNTFTPDEESCTPDEIARWRADCEAWRAGKREGLTETRCKATMSVDGKVALRVTPKGYGVGTYTLVDEDTRDFADRLERCIDQLDTALASKDPTP